jgi:short-subunit dehydrogenase
MILADKVVLITGGSSGIGKALAFEIGKKGAKVAITGRDSAKLQQTAAELKASNIDALAIIADVSKYEDCQAMAAEVVKFFGKLDVLINNAGVSMRAGINDLDPEVIKQVMDINFMGTVYATKACLLHLLKAKGCVAGISSIAGLQALPKRSGYSASKSAMQAFLNSLRLEHTEDGLKVLLVYPGFTSSNIRKTALNASGNQQGESPMDEGKMMSAEQAATIIVKAIEKERRSVVMTFQGKFTALVSRLFPALMDRLVYNHFKKNIDG